MDAANELDLRAALTLIRRRRWVVVSAILLCAAIAGGYSAAATKEYTATATIQFNENTNAAAASGISEPADSNPTGTQQTNLDLVTVVPVASLAARRLGGVTPAKIREMVVAAPLGQSNLVSVSATAQNPAYAARVADAYAKAFVDYQDSTTQRSIQSASRFVQSQYNAMSPGQQNTLEGQDLLQRVESLKIFADMTNGVTIAETARIPTEASSPKVPRNIAVGLFVGLLLGVALAFLLWRLDQRMRGVEDIEAALTGLPLLAAIPHEASQGRLGYPTTEDAYQMLRTSLRYFNVGRKLNSVLVTSAMPAEGKTSVTLNLARVAAASGARVLVIEADLRRPVLASYLGLSESRGLVDALISHEEPITRFVQLYATSTSDKQPRHMHVLVAGGRPPNPAELLESDAMMSLLAFAEEAYDLVLVDTPPLPSVADAIPLTQHVDGVLLVARVEVSMRNAWQRLRLQLAQLDVTVLGVAANDVRQFSSGVYGYAYARKADPDGPSALLGGTTTPEFSLRGDAHDADVAEASAERGSTEPRPAS